VFDDLYDAIYAMVKSQQVLSCSTYLCISQSKLYQATRCLPL